MSNQEEWNLFLESLFTNAFESYGKTKESEYLKEKQEQLDVRLEQHENAGKQFLEEYLFQMGLDAERKTEFVYRQGIKDGIWLLKNLGVLA